MTEMFRSASPAVPGAFEFSFKTKHLFIEFLFKSHFRDRRNGRRPLPPNLADNTKITIVKGRERWISFCALLPVNLDGKPLVNTLNWDNRGLAGLDRLDDALLRTLLMWTDCRRHKLVYAQPKNMKKKKIQEYDEESDAYISDIDLWIPHDPISNSGQDRLAMQVLLRFHKGHNKEIVPTWFPFVEEKLPVLCPPSHLLAKALAEEVID
ncbi:hypothetical protein F4782DRAFT_542919 [Xylaria castorea]|nr:hypothetical protein F4782DRAFT_542919 [Xylaria castorea]